MNVFHCLIIEGNERESTIEAKRICLSIVGNSFKYKISKNICSDVIWLNQKNNKNSIGVDDIRKIKNDAIIKPVECQSKIYILKNAHKMTEQAQNALLKTIEEPPPCVYFILLCDNSAKLLNTVISRSRIIKLVSKRSDKFDNDHELFVHFFIKKNQFELFKILSKYYNKKENLKDFLENVKKYFVDKIKNQNIKFGLEILSKLDYCIDLLQYNLNMQLVAQYLCID